ncbi:hypothetical protein SNEBB_011092 [Seison nebaliae]|nr:hypothetical protein SNEBB_011092 [Seison nebaliae]
MENKNEEEMSKAFYEKVLTLPISAYGYPVEKFRDLVVFPNIGYKWETILSDIENKWIPREEDVWVITYPKCGHTWSFDFLSMLISGETKPKETSKIANFIELRQENFDRLHEQKGPRLIMTHILPSWIPDKIKETSKLICIFRNPFDVVISYFHHISTVNLISLAPKNFHNQLHKKFAKEIDLKLFVDGFCNGNIPIGRYDHYINQCMEMIEKFSGHYFTFEDMKTNGVTELERIDKYLQLKNSKKFLENVQKATSFDSIKDSIRKRLQADMTNFTKRDDDGIKVLCRKGQIGNGKLELSIEQRQLIKETVLKGIANEQLKKKFSQYY